jgi:hypothetical protein
MLKFVGSAFIGLALLSVSIESGNDMFVIENNFIIDVLHHKLIHNISKSSEVEISSYIETLG